MPNIKSVKKDVLRSRLKRAINNATRSRIKTLTKKAATAIAEGNVEEVKSLLVVTVSTVDKAAKRGIIHKNAAARRKSRLMKRAAALAA